MQKLNVQGKLFLGVLLGLASALPLACDDNDGIDVMSDAGSGGNAGATGGTSGSGGRAGAAQGGRAGGAGTAGMTNGGSGGSGTGGGMPIAGGSAMAGSSGMAGEGGEGGEGGAPMDMGGAGGMPEMAGAAGAGEAGAGGAPSAPTYAENLDAACTVQATLNCGDTSPAEEKQACKDNYAFQIELVSACTTEIQAFVACLAKEPATSYMCIGGPFPSPNADVCAASFGAVNDCFTSNF